jgi:hypothetical protein
LIAAATVFGRTGGTDLFPVVRGMILDRYDDAGGDLSEATIATGLASGINWTDPGLATGTFTIPDGDL